jgi:L-threonylcarbamoyladenylate synthase
LIRIQIDPEDPDPAAIREAAAVIRSGGVAAVPTDTLYGLAADAFSAEAVARVFAIKGREDTRALPLVAGSAGQVEHFFGTLPPMAARLADAFWPGPLTLLVHAPDRLPSAVTAGGETVGIRVPAHRVTIALCLASGVPLTATSANPSGQPATNLPDVVAQTLGEALDVLVDAGPTPGGPPSTIVDTTGARPVLVRAGAIGFDEVQACVGRV